MYGNYPQNLPNLVPLHSLPFFSNTLTSTMKQIIFIFFLIPTLTFGQVKMESLIRKNGLAFEQGASTPFTGKAFDYFQNGGTKTILEYKDGLPNGEIKSWYSKDIKQAEGFVEKGQRTGTWKLYYESGKLKSNLRIKIM